MTDNRLEGKVALITGAARGQGRSHALRLARDGADIIAVDICAQIPTVNYELSTPDDLAETATLVEALGRRIVTRVADVRDRGALQTAIDEGVAELGGLDIVVANAGISPVGADRPPVTWLNTASVNLGGVINTLELSLPHLSSGASIVCVGSMAAFMESFESREAGFGASGYSFSKRAIARLVNDLARSLAPQGIRVNAVHPGNIDTPMVHNSGLYHLFRPDLEDPKYDDVKDVFGAFHLLPVDVIPPEEVSEAVYYLASDASKYVTGQQLRVEAGALLKSLPAGVPD
ncbi:mycofactocin-coupled SDR family oxidoreductase [Gordonia sp. NB41Y]|uniref:mycofactocin-coupled SDR family oxidoreductase n=1 Tax=Gordonia sp. NB41Y TaxID=875808 RepID=UPI000346D9DF|nr:mycofactocin-coupled SDR family oxidoreductase [Gordonia sp. NB41Y]EMP14288.2 3-ketoacyl-ACP reductase [Gordonia sp. NB41Y]WLP90791.1 mycofactocin-coupled SDR family oxidoreductase [Gordonia sp. NB41Y]